MRLSELFREVEFDGSIKNDADINLVTDDSRLVRPGSLFVCIRHRSFDGHTVALDALASGAAAVVTQDRLGLENELRVADSRSAYARLCAALCNHPERKLRMIGVTGTNGKTTVTTLIRNILSDSGTKTLLTGTVCNRLGDENLPSGLTTPKPPELYSLLSRAVFQGCKACVMEASSQALAQGRLEGIDFDAAVFTNITRDHLDYHGTFENYISAKKKLFEHSALSIVNLDDPRANEIIAASKGKIITFSTVLDCADYTAKNISLLSDCVRFELVSKGHIEHIEFASPGLFSVSNAMAAAVCAINLGIEPKDAAQSLAKSKSVCGRLERVECSAPYSVIIDYAHTPDGLEQVLRVNLMGAFLCAQEAAAQMKEKRWGRIISLASMAGRFGANKSGAHYAATKAGIVGMTLSLAKTLGPYNITVNCVSPGRINTELTRVLPQKVQNEICSQIPLGRIGEPSEVASVIAFLASEQASYVSGSCVDVLGGYIA
ncbi:MAG: UDP-N-acetylmuramyl-tripeptide synthetase [Ruminococcaceae bacterium]|nr:UDP-N-acetylmuramyl-tripeptide synthetase [Oscillospiraceae bacterium]